MKISPPIQQKLTVLSTLLSLVLTGCVGSSDKTETHVSEVLTIPPIDSTVTESPSLALLNKHQIYPLDTKEDPYSPIEKAPPIIVEVPLTFEEELAQAALSRTMHRVRYDGSYLKIAYPMGDVPPEIGVCTDVVIRAYRELGIDLQKNVHEDMRRNFSRYPSRKRWGLRKPDTNIDHRRVYNLQAFFERNGRSLEVTNNPKNYKPGDLVTWQLNPKMPHIGVVLEMTSDEDPDRHLIAHNIGNGPVIEDMLFDFKISGHYRYQPKQQLKQAKAQKNSTLGKSL
ncbi:DUF1287 domain-containing protein [Leucothrix arctica]|uniref:DUF1287 domain-containing protein n=1 Tax=Leucothrix arctica TaxID=1481894 RepID=A0A317C488_9GAMM|nr:DUF1287 domain-containing protein [Leucothrix arctica]PWQ93465.1 hypothetical protein DKT75_17735 [Leucothrix arctica]